MDLLKPYLDIIFNERSWSWTVVGIFYLIIGLIVRSWFLKPLVSRAKQLDRGAWHDMKGHYLTHSVVGWLFFLIPLIIIVVVWNRGKLLPLEIPELIALCFSLVCFVLSIIFHVQAFAIAALLSLKTALKENEKHF